jgi:NADPH:quinone reductase-like Zn-dependent oxidoreductase
VQVNIQAAALNRLDIFVRNGWPGIKLEYPHIPGADGAGVISAVGAGISEVAVGDRVVINGTMSCGKCEFCLAGKENMCLRGGILGEDMRGTYAEYVVVPENNVLKLPDDIPVEAAAAGSLVFLTAWHSLITRGGLRPGESVLIVGAGGGVNTASIQIAKLVSATVYVVGSSDQKLDQARALGADFLINRSEEDWGKAIFKLTNRRGVDVVVDNVGGPTWATSIRALARGGRLLVVGGTAGYTAETPVNYIFRKHVSILGSTMAPPGDFRDVMELIFAGRLQPVVDSVRPLAEAAEAQKLLDSGEVFGKLVLRP